MKSVEDTIRQELPSLFVHRTFSSMRVTQMREIAAEARIDSGILIGINGSYARREASTQSDLDFLAVSIAPARKESAEEQLGLIAPRLLQVVGKAPAKDGSFGHAHDLSSMLSNIGGDHDTNEALTRRILFLLEGDWVHGEDLAAHVRSSLISCYVRENITSHQLALFLLNDLIRYYRTICVDFEFKTMQADYKKPWGTRNVKLVFSRKLLYFSDVLAVAETAQRTFNEKTKALNRLFYLPVIDRIIDICGNRSLRALRIYEEFLNEMGKPEIRSELDRVTEKNRNESEIFRVLKDRGHHFSWELLSLFKATYEPSHPIHKALVL